MPRLHLIVGPIGIGVADNFLFDMTRPARHCGICGDSFQPWIARTDEYLTDGEVQLAVQIEIEEWRRNHRKKHSEAEHKALKDSGNMMTPEAALRLIPLGIYPIGDMAVDPELEQAGREAPRGPFNDIPDFL